MLQTITNLVGKPINSDEVKQFIDNQGLKYPKKDIISTNKNDNYYYIVGKKQGIEMLFTIESTNPTIPFYPAEKKNVYYPILECIWIRDKAKGVEMPLALKKGMNFEEVKKVLGEPTRKFSDNAISWLEDGVEKYYSWYIPVDKNDLEGPEFQISMSPDGEFDEFEVVVKTYVERFQLFHRLPKVEPVYRTENVPNTATRFVDWAIPRDLFAPQNDIEGYNDAVQKVKKGELSAYNFVYQHIATPSIYEHHFDLKLRAFLSYYLNRFGGNDIWYHTDIKFLEDKNGKLTQEDLNAVIDQRYDEYLKNGSFLKSEQLS